MVFGQLATVLAWPFKWILFFVSGLVPRDRRLWALGSSNGVRFADNAKWLFVHLLAEPPDRVRVVWVARDKALAARLAAAGLPAVHAGGVRGLWTTMRAGVWVFDSTVWDIGYWTSLRAKKVQLWHGIPLKRVKLAIGNVRHPDHEIRHAGLGRRLWLRLTQPWAAVRHHMVVATSEEVAERWTRAFDVPRRDVVVTGYPRNDALLGRLKDPMEEAAPAEFDRLRAQARTLVFYLPTFRDRLLGSGMETGIDWPRLDAWLAAHDAAMVSKHHPRDRATAPPSGLERVVALPPDVDPYPLLREADVLMTDYSSIYFDFLLLDRPIVFYAFDLEEYTRRDRPLYDAYEEAAPGPKATTMDELESALGEASAVAGGGPDAWAEARARVRARVLAQPDDQAAARTAAMIHRRFVRREAAA
jgi:CDP-glycerol glycerophosphotransferase (TagB/SpsB family)